MKRPRHFINSLEKGLSILNTFSLTKPDLNLTELARENGMTLGSAHRYLLTLKELGYVAQNYKDKRYLLTTKVLSLGFSVLSNMDLKKRLLHHMMQMAKDMNVSTQCAVLDGVEIVYIERVRSSDVVNLDLNTGSRLPAYCTSMGKAILASMDEKKTRELIKKMNIVPLTPYTITKKTALLKDLKLTKERGYAINNQELMLGLKTLAAPIFKYGKVEAAFGVSYPIHRVEGNNLEDAFIKRMLEISQKVSIK
jgi:IclR family pca regulon transcriptional regulator